MIRCGRALSPRVCLRGLTQFQLPSAAVSQSTRRAVFGSVSAHQHNGFLRSFAAASAAPYPRKPLGNFLYNETSLLPSQGDDGHEWPDHASHLRSSEPAGTTDSAGLSDTLVEQAKNDGTIFELLPSSVDELAAELHQSSGERTSRLHTGSKSKSADQTISKPSRLNKSTAPPARVTQSEETIDGSLLRKESWRIQKEILKDKFPEGWKPRKRLSPDAIEGIKALHARFPEEYTTQTLAAKFEISPEAIRRILKSKWEPSPDEEEARRDRWFNRGKRVWSQWAELGKKPPKRWRREGVVRDPSWNRKTGPRMEYPYVPRKHERRYEDEESTQRKLGGHLL